jgi:hypothetical protein
MSHGAAAASLEAFRADQDTALDHGPDSPYDQ